MRERASRVRKQTLYYPTNCHSILRLPLSFRIHVIFLLLYVAAKMAKAYAQHPTRQCGPLLMFRISIRKIANFRLMFDITILVIFISIIYCIQVSSSRVRKLPQAIIKCRLRYSLAYLIFIIVSRLNSISITIDRMGIRFQIF